jgi:hypothetical protein
MIPVKFIDPDDLPLFAMQLLPADEMEEMALMLQHSLEARRQLAEIYGDLSVFAHSAEMHDAPALGKQRLMKAVAKEKKATPINPLDRYTSGQQDAYEARGAAMSSLLDDEPVEKSFGEKVLPWTGWLLAAGLAAFAFVLTQQNGDLKTTVASDRAQILKTQTAAEAASALMETMKDPTAVHATLTAVETKPVPSGRVTYVMDKGSLVFLASNLQPLDPAKTYELWVIPADGRNAIPAGTFKPDEHGNASVMLPELAKGIEAKAFGVTVEDAEGSLTPTAPVIMKGSPS